MVALPSSRSLWFPRIDVSSKTWNGTHDLHLCSVETSNSQGSCAMQTSCALRREIGEQTLESSLAVCTKTLQVNTFKLVLRSFALLVGNMRE